MDDGRDPLEELLGAYALDAVDDHERRQVGAYLESHPGARAEVDRHREVAELLAAPAEPPPAGLWARIAGALDERPPTPGPRLAQVLPHRRRRWPAVVAAVAAAVLVVVTAVVTSLATRDGGRSQSSSQTIERAYGAALVDPEGRHVTLTSSDEPFSADAVVLPGGAGFLAAQALPALPATQTWQLWGVYGDDEVISLGVLGSRPRIQPFTASDDLRALVVTRERAGGVVSSTSGAVLVGEL
jgi:anti-sigma-K factor RskA